MLLSTWHPDLYKDDPEKHKLAIQKVQEFKAAYEAIKKETEKSSETLLKMYEILELDYGAPFDEVTQSFEKLKGIYKPDRFTEDPILFQKVKCKLNEITNSYRHIKNNKIRISDQGRVTIEHTQDSMIIQSTHQTSSVNQADQLSGCNNVNEDRPNAIHTEQKERVIPLGNNKLIETENKSVPVKSWSRTKTFITMFTAIFISGIISAVFFGTDIHGNKLASVNNKELETNIEKLSIELNKKVPMYIDKDSILQSTSANGFELTLNCKLLNYKSTDLDASTTRNIVEANIISSICLNKTVSDALKLGVIVNYNIIGNDNNQITNIDGLAKAINS